MHLNVFLLLLWKLKNVTLFLNVFFYFLSSFFFGSLYLTVCYCYYFVVLFVCSGQAVHVENPLFTFTIM